MNGAETICEATQKVRPSSYGYISSFREKSRAGGIATAGQLHPSRHSPFLHQLKPKRGGYYCLE
jgi:hypothetical protein